MHPKSLAAAALLFSASTLAAQRREVAGIFVSTLGTDTIQIERYTRTRDKLEGDILRKSPRVQIIHYVADLARGKFKGMSVTTRRFGADAASLPAFSMVALLADTTGSIEVQRDGRPDSANSGRRSLRLRAAPAIPGTPPSVGLYEQILAFNSPAARDSAVVGLLGTGIAPNSTLTIWKRARDSVAFLSSFFPGWIEVGSVDAAGRIQSLDASATTVKAMTRRVVNLRFDSIAEAWGAHEAAHGAAGQVPPQDSGTAVPSGKYTLRSVPSAVETHLRKQDRAVK